MKKRFDPKTIELIYDIYQKPKYRGVKTRLSHVEQIQHRKYAERSMSTLVSLCESKAQVEQLEQLMEEMATRLYDDVISARQRLGEFVRLLQNLEKKEDKKLVTRNGPMLDLPDHVCDMKEMKLALNDMKLYLSRILSNRRGRGCPRLITIACSLDGYTPEFQLEFLLTSVLNIITELYGEGQKRNVDVVVSEHAPKSIHDVVDKYLLDAL